MRLSDEVSGLLAVLGIALSLIQLWLAIILLPPGWLTARWRRISGLRPVGIRQALPRRPRPRISADLSYDARFIIGLSMFVIAVAIGCAMLAYGFVNEVKVLELGLGLMLPLMVFQQFGVLVLAGILHDRIADQVENRRVVTGAMGVVWALAIAICVRLLLVMGDRIDAHWLWFFIGMQAICFIVVSAIPIVMTFVLEGSERLGAYLRAVRK